MDNFTSDFFILATKVELTSTLMLTGLIWTIQLVHYPLLLRVGVGQFPEYHQAHCKRITWLVAPLMILELLSSLVITAHSGFDPIYCGRLGLVMIAWLSTALIQVPLHNKLTAGFNAETISRLVLSNWIRTFAWSLRSLLIVFGFDLIR